MGGTLPGGQEEGESGTCSGDGVNADQAGR